ncbi:glycosyltransferase family 2 protein [Candidatus Dependentiae bacterium]|nr:glycosyltransferase family 2 protein [Candidatus Dependentiae bacterium]
MVQKISIVIACYNEAQNIPELYTRVTKAFDQTSYPYELLFVDNASIDNSRTVYEQLVSADPGVKALFMSRNFGTSQTSFFAGLQHATGDAVILIEGDLQDPPELIPKLIKKWKDGFDVVYAVRKKRRGTPVRKIFYKLFYMIFKWFSYLKIPVDAGDFSLLDRKVVNVIKKLPEKDIYIRGLRAWAGFKQTGVEYVRDARLHGQTSIKFFDNFSWFKKAIINFSYKPLEFISKLTIIATLLTIIAAGIYLYFYFNTNMPRGFPTLLMVMFVFGTIQLLSLSIIGEYLIRMFQEIKGRPPYIISEVLQQKETEPTNTVRPECPPKLYAKGDVSRGRGIRTKDIS